MKKTHQFAVLIVSIISTLIQPVNAQAIRGWGTGGNGAVIGAGTGAAIGAIIDKQNRAVGGVVGGVLGGTAGYAIGRKSTRRWSPQATGTAIGTGAGAAAGAIINKRNRVVGGVIGGVVGGAAGYAIGKHKDNVTKQREEAARVAAAEKAAAEKAAADRAAANAAEQAKAVAQNTGVPTKANESPAKVQEVISKPSSASTEVVAASLIDAGKITAPFVQKTGFLPNDTYGDPLTPYPTSEYRRKSW